MPNPHARSLAGRNFHAPCDEYAVTKLHLMNPLRHLLFVVALVFAQWAAGAHAVEHAVAKDGALPAHACELCLAAHDLGSALPGVASLPPVVSLVLIPEALSFFARSHLPAPITSQRAPPVILL